MAGILLLCDSNLSRRTQRIESNGHIKVKKCTTSGAFKAAVKEAKETSIYVAGIETIVNESLGASVDPMAAIDTNVNMLMMDLRNKVDKLGIKVGVAPILPWTRFNRKVLGKVDAVMSHARKTHQGKIFFSEPCRNVLRIQKQDGVHLTDRSADTYADYVTEEIRKMQDFLSSRKRKSDGESSKAARMRMDVEENDGTRPSGDEVDGDQEPEDDQDGTVLNFQSGRDVVEVESESEEEERPRRTSLGRQLHERLIVLEEKSFQDNLMFARQQEELDAIANEKSEDRVIFTGIYIENFFKMTPEEKIDKMKMVTQSLVDKILGDGQARIEFVNQINKSARSGPVTMNVRLDSREAARSFRSKFARTMKDYNRDGNMPNELRGINVMPSQRLSTRVRIDILRSIADYISTETNDDVKAYVIAHIPKPVLKVEISRRGSTFTRAMDFTEAIEYTRVHHDRSLRGLQLHQAYARAGSTFKGTLQQHFVVLK